MSAQQTQCGRAMILARGMGTRMQKDVAGVRLDRRTAGLAAEGAKGLIPIGRPFLDHILQALMDAGVRDFCLIVGPGASAIRCYYQAVSRKLPADVRLSLAIQEKPLGTANAVAAGRDWAGDSPFLVLNSDNYYYPQTVAALAAAPAPATVAYERDGLLARGNIPADRVARFAVMDIDPDGMLRRIIEKPADPDAYAREGKLYVSMNCFLLTREIFKACDAIEPDPVRGEYELPTAVQYTIDRLGLRYRAVPSAEGVLDLTGRADIEPVRKLLAGHVIHFPPPSGMEPGA